MFSFSPSGWVLSSEKLASCRLACCSVLVSEGAALPALCPHSPLQLRGLKGWSASCAGPACKALRMEPWLDLLIGLELLDRQPGVGRIGRTGDGEQE